MKGSVGTSTVTHKIPHWNKRVTKTVNAVIIKLGYDRICVLCKNTIKSGRKARLVGEQREPTHLRCKN